MNHDIDDSIPVVKREAMSEGGIEEINDAMEELPRKGVGFIFGLGEFHGSNDRFVDAQVCTRWMKMRWKR